MGAAYREKHGISYPADSHLYPVELSPAFAFIEDAARFAAIATRRRW